MASTSTSLCLILIRCWLAAFFWHLFIKVIGNLYDFLLYPHRTKVNVVNNSSCLDVCLCGVRRCKNDNYTFVNIGECKTEKFEFIRIREENVELTQENLIIVEYVTSRPEQP